MIKMLNEIYEPLWHEAEALTASLKQSGYRVRWGYYGLHSTKRDGHFETDYFPIPVLSVEGVCDIGLAPDHLFIECQLTRAEALAFDFAAIPWPFEAYGVLGYLEDFYNDTMKLSGIHARIEASREEAIGLQFTFAQRHDAPISAIVDWIKAAGAHMSNG